jgi:hypothetical protein
MGSVVDEVLPPWISKYPYTLEIKNDTRKYVLAATSYFDAREWYNAILMQIQSQQNNQLLSRVRQKIGETE